MSSYLVYFNFLMTAKGRNIKTVNSIKLYISLLSGGLFTQKKNDFLSYL